MGGSVLFFDAFTSSDGDEDRVSLLVGLPAFVINIDESGAKLTVSVYN